MIDQILQNPDDDALRQVWADQLQEKGDPRGEVIAIHIAALARGGFLTPEEDTRARAILSKHALKWISPLEEIVMHKAGLLFDRGVMSSCQIQVKKVPALAKVTGNPMWSTLRRIWFCDKFAWDKRIVPFLAHPVFARLEEVTSIGQSVFAALANHERELPFKTINTLDDAWANPGTEFSDVAKALPHLRHLGWEAREVDSHVNVFAWPLLKQLEALNLTAYYQTPTWESVSRANDLRNLKVFELRPDWIRNQGCYRTFSSFRFERGTTGRFSRLTVDIGGYHGPFAPYLDVPVPRRDTHHESYDRNLKQHFDSIPADALDFIELKINSPTTVRALRRFTNAEIVTPGPGPQEPKADRGKKSRPRARS